MTVQDEVRAVLEDRSRQAVAPEERPDGLRLAVERLGDRRVVEQRDAEGAERDLVEALRQRLDLGARLRVDRAQRRLAEVRQPEPAEAAHEPLRPGDADAARAQRRVRAVEHADARAAQHGAELLGAAGMEVVVAEHGHHGRLHPAAGLGQDLALLGLAVRREVACEEHEVGLSVDRVERGHDRVAVLRGAVHVPRRGDADTGISAQIRRKDTGRRLHGHCVPLGVRGYTAGMSSPDVEHPLPAIEASMKRAIAALREADIPFLLAGSLAVWARGGPETRHDLDFVVKPEDADRALAALADAGMRPEKPPEEWLHKAWDGDVLIDLIFAPRGLEVTDEVIERGDLLHVIGITIPVMAIEDVLATKLMALHEHELDYTSVLRIARAVREQVDWPSLRARTGGSPYAAAFFVMCEELGLVSSDAHGRRGADVRVLPVGQSGRRHP